MSDGYVMRRYWKCPKCGHENDYAGDGDWIKPDDGTDKGFPPGTKLECGGCKEGFTVN